MRKWKEGGGRIFNKLVNGRRGGGKISQLVKGKGGRGGAAKYLN